jgi:hypothetical protein
MSSLLSESSVQSAKSTTSTLSHAILVGVGSGIGSGVSPSITVEVDTGDNDLRGIEGAGYESGVCGLGNAGNVDIGGESSIGGGG